MTKTVSAIFCIMLTTLLLTGCSPEIGSQAWCDEVKAKPTGDITGNEAADFAKHCLLN